MGFSLDGRTFKIFDFGLCRVVKKRTSSDRTYEMTGNTGSLRYMAPEVVLNQPYTEKVDVYSWAMVVWCMARNEQPYRGITVAQHRAKIVQGGERPTLASSWPAPFRALLADSWAADVAKRPSFRQVCASLDAMIEADGAPAIAAPSPLKKSVSALKKLFSM